MKWNQLIIASEFHGPFFYGLRIVKKRSWQLQCARFRDIRVQNVGVLFHCTNSNNLTFSDPNLKDSN